MKKAAVHTLGCRTNQLESSIISGELEKSGFSIVKFNEIADLYVINSCTVTLKSDSESRYAIRQAKRRNLNAKIVITGCYAQSAKDELVNMPELDLVVGNVEKKEIVNIIIKNLFSESSCQKIFVSDMADETDFGDKVIGSAQGRARANIKIQDGCNFKCSYCIIPSVRGKSRSNSLSNIICGVNEFVKNGFQEIVISGIHLGQWGMDLNPPNDLSSLLKEIEKIDELKRYRLSSIDPMEFSDELINTLVSSAKFCHHLHISLQSGCNKVLKAMKRRYSVEFYTDLIYKLNENIKNLAVGSDIIVGFPGETEDDFIETYNNLKALPLSYIHVFSYS